MISYCYSCKKEINSFPTNIAYCENFFQIYIKNISFHRECFIQYTDKEWAIRDRIRDVGCRLCHKSINLKKSYINITVPYKTDTPYLDIVSYNLHKLCFKKVSDEDLYISLTKKS